MIIVLYIGAIIVIALGACWIVDRVCAWLERRRLWRMKADSINAVSREMMSFDPPDVVQREKPFMKDRDLYWKD